MLVPADINIGRGIDKGGKAAVASISKKTILFVRLGNWDKVEVLVALGYGAVEASDIASARSVLQGQGPRVDLVLVGLDHEDPKPLADTGAQIHVPVGLVVGPDVPDAFDRVRGARFFGLIDRESPAGLIDASLRFVLEPGPVPTENVSASMELRNILPAALNSMTDAIFISDLQGKFLHFNEGFATFHRFANLEECAKTFEEYPDILEVLDGGRVVPVEFWAVPRALRGEVGVNVVFGLRRKDTQEQWLGSYCFAPIRNESGAIVGSVVSARDITQERQAVLALEESEARFTVMFESSPVPSALADENGAIVDLNSAYIELTGFGREEILGHTVVEMGLMKAEDRRRNIEALAQAGGQLVDFEFALTRKDGTQRTVIATSRELRLHGRFHRLARFVDVTERRAAEKALAESEAKFSALFHSNPVANVVFGDQSLIIDANEAYSRLSGYSLDELIGQTTLGLKIMSPQDRVRMLETFEKNGGLLEDFEFPLKRRDGGVRTVLASSKHVFIQGQLRRMGTFVDITERKVAEAALYAEKESLRVTLLSIGDGVITTDTEGRVVLVNEVAERLTGWQAQDAAGKPLTEVFRIIHEETRQPCADPVEKVLQRGEVVELANHTALLSRDGRELPIADSGAPIRDPEGAIVGVVLVFRDMTEKYRLVDTLQRTARLDSLGVLAGGIAHDFNNLLGGLFAYLDLAKRRTKDQRTSGYLAKAAGAIDRARNLTHQLLTFAKGGEPIKKVGSLGPFLEETVRFALSGTSVTGEFHWSADLWSCNFDKNQIGQVIDNLVINAQQAMPHGGTVKVTAENTVVAEGEVPRLEPGNYVRICVQDQGVGIPPEALPHVFDPFYTTKPTGHGLGLATSHSIAVRHGGALEVQSELGHGAQFDLYLPACSEEIAPTAGDAEGAVHRGRGTFVVMDDDKILREGLGEMLATLGYRVVLKSNGQDAVDFLFRENRAGRSVAGMIFDLTVPGGLGGMAALQKIRERNKTVPVFVISGYSDDTVLAHSEANGFTGSLSKPFTLQELTKLLDQHLRL